MVGVKTSWTGHEEWPARLTRNGAGPPVSVVSVQTKTARKPGVLRVRLVGRPAELTRRSFPEI